MPLVKIEKGSIIVRFLPYFIRRTKKSLYIISHYLTSYNLFLLTDYFVFLQLGSSLINNLSTIFILPHSIIFQINFENWLSIYLLVYLLSKLISFSLNNFLKFKHYNNFNKTSTFKKNSIIIFVNSNTQFFVRNISVNALNEALISNHLNYKIYCNFYIIIKKNGSGIQRKILITTTIFYKHSNAKKKQSKKVRLRIMSDDQLWRFSKINSPDELKSNRNNITVCSLKSDIHPAIRRSSLSLPELSTSVKELQHVPSYLKNYRKRIDAGIEEQRQQREILQELQNTILKCRLNNAKASSQNTTLLQLGRCCQNHCFDFNNRFESRRQSCAELRNLDNTDQDEDSHFLSTSTVIFPTEYNNEFSTLKQHNDTLYITRINKDRCQNQYDEQSKAALIRELEMKNVFLENKLDILRQRLDETIDAKEKINIKLQQTNKTLAKVNANKLQFKKHFNEKFLNRLYEFWIEFTMLKRKINELRSDLNADFSTCNPSLLSAKRILLKVLQQAHASTEREKSEDSQKELKIVELQTTLNDLSTKNHKLQHDNEQNEIKIMRLELQLQEASTEKKELLINLLIDIDILINDTSSYSKSSLDAESINILQGRILKLIKTMLNSQSDVIEKFKRQNYTEHAQRVDLETRLNECQASLSEVNQAFRLLKETNEDLQKEKEEISKRYTKMQKKLMEVETQKKTVETNLLVTNQQLDKHKSDSNEAIINTKAEHIRQIDELRREHSLHLEEIHLEMDRIKQNAKQMSSEKMNCLEKENFALLKKCDFQTKNITDLTESLKKTNNELNKFQTRCNSYEKELRMLDSKIIELEKSIEAKDLQSETLQRKVFFLEKDKEHTIAVQNNEIDHIRSELAKAETKISVLNTEIQDAYLNSEKNKSEIDALHSALREQTDYNEKLNIKCIALMHKNDSLHEQIHEYEKNLKDNTTEIERLHGECIELTRERDIRADELSYAIASMEEERANYHKQMDKIRKMGERLDLYKKEARARREAENRSKWSAKKAMKDLELAEQKCAEMAEKLSIEREQNRQEVNRLEQLLENEITRRLNLMDEVSKITAEKRNDLQQNTKSDVLNTLFTEQNQSLNEENHRFRSCLKIAEEEIKNLKADNAKIADNFKKEIHALSQIQRNQIEELHAKRVKFDSEQHEFVCSIEGELSDARMRLVEYERRESMFKEQLSCAETRIERSAEMIRRLYADLEEISEQSDSQNIEAEKKAEQLRRDLSKKVEQIENWQHRFKEEHNMCTEIKMCLDKKDEILKQQTNKLQTLQQSYEESKREISQHLRSHNELLLRISELESNCDLLRQKIVVLEAGTNTSETKCQELRLKLDIAEENLKGERKKLISCEDKLQKNKERFLQLEMEKNKIEAELSKSLNKMEEINIIKRQLEKTKEELLVQLNIEKEKNENNKKITEEFQSMCEELQAQIKTHSTTCEANEKQFAKLLQDIRITEREKFDALNTLKENYLQLQLYKNRLVILTQNRDAAEIKLRKNRSRLKQLGAQFSANKRKSRRIIRFAYNLHLKSPQTKTSNNINICPNNQSETSFDTSTATTSLHTICSNSPVEHIFDEANLLNQKDKTTHNKLGYKKEKTDKKILHSIASKNRKKEYNTSMIQQSRRRIYKKGMPKQSESDASNSSSATSSTSPFSKVKKKSSKLNKSRDDSNKFASPLKASLVVMRNRILELDEEKKQRLEDINQLKIENNANSNENIQLNKQNLELKTQLKNLEAIAKRARDQIHIAISDERQALQTQISELNSRIKKAEMHAHHSMEQARNCSDDLRIIESERNELRLTETRLHGDCEKLNQRINDLQSKLEMAYFELNKIEKERNTLAEHLKDAELNVNMYKEKCIESEKTIAMFRDEIEHLKKVEKILSSSHQAESFLDKGASVLQRRNNDPKAVDEIIARLQTVEQEREQLRRDFLDSKSKLNRMAIKLNAMQSTNSEVNAEKQRLADRIKFFEKSERKNESLAHDLKQITTEKQLLIVELNDNKSQLQRCISECRELELQLERLRYDSASYKAIAEKNEEDKCRMETLIRQANLERQMLNKSLVTMEKQNAEINRQYMRLQHQITQMESENDANKNMKCRANIESNLKRKIERLEADLYRLNQTKRQMEKMIDQREQNYTQKIKMYEIQINSLKEQLEKKRENVRHPSARPSLIPPVRTSSQTLNNSPICAVSVTQKFPENSNAPTKRTIIASTEIPLATIDRHQVFPINNVSLMPSTSSAVLHDAHRHNTSLGLKTTSISTYIHKSNTITTVRHVPPENHEEKRKP